MGGFNSGLDEDELFGDHPVCMLLDCGPTSGVVIGNAKFANADWCQMTVPITSIGSLCPTHNAHRMCAVAHNIDRVEIVCRVDANAMLLGKMDAEHFCDLYLCTALVFYYQGPRREFDVDDILPEQIGLRDKDGSINEPSKWIWNIFYQIRN